MRIITDSTSDLTPQMVEALGIDWVIPMKILIDGKEYQDKVDVSDEQFYEMLPQCTELPKTSLVSAGEYCDVFNRFPDEELLVMPISSGLSGSFNSACLAKDMLGREDIYVVDSKSTALALALMVRIAAQRRDEGVAAPDIAVELAELSGRVRVYAVVETLKYLVMGGRLSKAAGFVGSALNLKPLICLKDGVLTSVGKARGSKAAVRLMRQLVDANECIDTDYPIYFAHAFNQEGLAVIKDAFPEYVDGAQALTVGCIVGTHTGPKVTAIGFITKN